MPDIASTSAFWRNSLSTEPARPTRTLASWQRQACALALGGLGGYAFALLGAPLAWMLGAMTATTVAALAGAQLSVPLWLRAAMLCVIGVMLGAAFTPALGELLPHWLGAIALLVVYCLAIAAMSYAFFRRVAGYDHTTAYFASAPGGIVEMTLQSEQAGADARVVSLIHATRILVAVATVPVYFRWLHGLDVPTLPPAIGGANWPSLEEALVLLACGALGYPLGRIARLPLPPLTGPMIASAVVHLAGVSHVGPPPALVATAQVVLGVGIGCRFIGLSLRDVRTIMSWGAAAALLLIAAAVATALLAAPLFGLRFESLLLALVPGGLAEMSLIALSLGIDTAFVSTLHILRIVLVILGARAGFHWLESRRRRGTGHHL